MNEEKIQRAVESLKIGDRQSARVLLAQVVKVDPCNETAWLWLAASVDEPDRRRFCLQRALSINPDNTRARQMLGKTAALTGPVNVTMTEPTNNSPSFSSASATASSLEPVPPVVIQGTTPAAADALSSKPGSGSLGGRGTGSLSYEGPARKPDSGSLGRRLAAGLMAAAAASEQPVNEPDSGSLGKLPGADEPSTEINEQMVKPGSGSLGGRSSAGYDAPQRKPDSGSLSKRALASLITPPPEERSTQGAPVPVVLPPWMETTTQIRVRPDTPEVPLDSSPIFIEAPVQAFLTQLENGEMPGETAGISDRMSAYLPSYGDQLQSDYPAEHIPGISPEKVIESEITAALSLEDYQRYEEAINHYAIALQIDADQPDALVGKGRCLAWLTHLDGEGLDEGLTLIHAGWKAGGANWETLERTGIDLGAILDMYAQAVFQEFDHTADGAVAGDAYSSQQFLQRYAVRILKTMSLAWRLAPREAVEGKVTKVAGDVQNTPFLNDEAKRSFAARYARIDREMHPDSVPSSSITKKKDRCFIATAAMGDIDHPDVVALRRWRDLWLARSSAGRWLISTYYARSPMLAEWISHSMQRRKVIRILLVKPAAWLARHLLD